METERWGGYDRNPFYNPEKCGLEIVETTEEPNMSYEFHYVVLWKDIASGKLYWSEDSGCSCPSPFEDVSSLSDLTELDKTKDEYERRKRLCAAGEYA